MGKIVGELNINKLKKEAFLYRIKKNNIKEFIEDLRTFRLYKSIISFCEEDGVIMGNVGSAIKRFNKNKEIMVLDDKDFTLLIDENEFNIDEAMLLMKAHNYGFKKKYNDISDTLDLRTLEVFITSFERLIDNIGEHDMNREEYLQGLINASEILSMVLTKGVKFEVLNGGHEKFCVLTIENDMEEDVRLTLKIPLMLETVVDILEELSREINKR